MPLSPALLPLLLAATIDVPPGADLAAAIGSARPGDVIRLGPGEWAGGLGEVKRPLRIEGAGPERTTVIAPEGQDGAVVRSGGALTVSGLALRAGRARSALKVLGGRARVEDAVLEAGSCGIYVDGGALEGRGTDLAGGEYGLLARAGEVSLAGGSARGGAAGVALLGSARLALARFAITGPSREAGLTLAGGEASLEAVVIRTPGPSGVALAGAEASLHAIELDVAGASEEGGFLGDCLQVRRGSVGLTGGALVRCGGAAAEAVGGALALTGVEVQSTEVGCLVLLDRATADLSGNVCAGRGPGLVASGGARARLRGNRWRTDPALWVDCGSGARVEVGRGERVAEPCVGKR